MNATNECGRCAATIKYDTYQWIGFIQFITYFTGIEYLVGFLPDGWSYGVNYFSGLMALMFIMNLLGGRYKQTEIKPKAISMKILPLMWSSIMMAAVALCINILDLPLSKQTVVPTVLLLIINAILTLQLLQGKYTVYHDTEK